MVRAIHDWIVSQRWLRESGLGHAIKYMAGMLVGLTKFLDDPRIPLDNNHAERGLRSVVLGRKNHYGSRSKRGTEVAALFYSLMESAKLAGVEPKSYLLKATHVAIADRNACACLTTCSTETSRQGTGVPSRHPNFRRSYAMGRGEDLRGSGTETRLRSLRGRSSTITRNLNSSTRHEYGVACSKPGGYKPRGQVVGTGVADHERPLASAVTRRPGQPSVRVPARDAPRGE